MKFSSSNQIKIGIILSYFSIGIRILIELLYTPVMLRFLGQNEYGIYQLAYSTVSYLGLLSFGFGSAYIRYYSRYKVKNEENNIAKLNGLFMIIFTIISFVSIIVGCILILNLDKVFGNSLSTSEFQQVRILMFFTLINLAITFPASVYQSYIIAKEQFFFQRVINILTTVLNPFLCLPLLLLGYKAIALVVISTILTILSFLINIWFCKNKINMKFTFRNLHLKVVKEVAAFSVFIFINQVIDQINWNLDKFILGIYSGAAGVAIYSVGATINNMYLQFSTVISSVFVPRINKIVFSDKADNKLTELFTKIGRIQALVLMLILTGYIFVGKQFTIIWAGNSYIEAYYVTLCLIIPVTIPLIQNLGIEIQRAKNMHYFRAYVYIIIAVINIVLSIQLCKLYGPIGSAIGTGISLLIGNVFIMNLYYHYKLGINIKYFIREIIPLIKGIIIPFIFGILTMKYIKINSLPMILIWAIIYTIIYTISVWKFSMNAYEKNLIFTIIKKLRGKKDDRNN
ncbi:oligosaccharide flippase family protein [Clostridium baratii]